MPTTTLLTLNGTVKQNLVKCVVNWFVNVKANKSLNQSSAVFAISHHAYARSQNPNPVKIAEGNLAPVTSNGRLRLSSRMARSVK